LETSNNHVVAGQDGEIIGHIPKRNLEGFVPEESLPAEAPRLSNRNMMVKAEKWTVQG